jgi:DNA-binding MarR family transcriptional regulator
MATTLAPPEGLAARLRLAIARTARRLRQEALAGVGGVELSPTLAAALATIDVHGPLTPSELAERERIQRPTATRIVARLDEAGLVERTPDPADGRAYLVSLSAEGRALLRRIRRRKDEYLARRLRGLDRADIEALERAADVLERLLDERERP